MAEGFESLNVAERHFCMRCNKILQDAVQFQCGCRMCRECADERVAGANVDTYHCDVCNSLMEKNDRDYFYFEDTSIRKEIKERVCSLPSSRSHGAVGDHSLVHFANSSSLGRRLPPDRGKVGVLDIKSDQSKTQDSLGARSPEQNIPVLSSLEDCKTAIVTHVNEEAMVTSSGGKEIQGTMGQPAVVNSRTKSSSIPTRATTTLLHNTSRKQVSQQVSRDSQEISRNQDPYGLLPREQQTLAFCAECQGSVNITKLIDHRKNCWKLHLYNGKSFKVYNELSLESSLQSILSSSPYPLVERTFRGFGDGVRGIYNSFQDRVRRIRSDLQRELSLRASIDDPIFQTMRWKVENVSLRVSENCNLLSRAFYSSIHGYNLRLRLDFHGEYFLLHVVVVRGGNDDVLLWPYWPSVNIAVLGGTSVDAYENPSVRPADRCYSDSQGIIISSMTVLRVWKEYVIDDCFFIRCKII